MITGDIGTRRLLYNIMLKFYDYEFEAHPILPSVCTVNCGCATVLGILELEPEPDCYDLAGTGPEVVGFD